MKKDRPTKGFLTAEETEEFLNELGFADFLIGSKSLSNRFNFFD
jgi:hypothetical protein